MRLLQEAVNYLLILRFWGKVWDGKTRVVHSSIPKSDKSVTPRDLTLYPSLVAFLLLGTPPTATAQIFRNGSFETGTIDVNHVVDIPGWNSLDSSGAIIPFVNFITDGRDWGVQNRLASDGAWFLQVNNFDGNVPPSPTRFFQDVVTVPGVSYRISFDFQMAQPEPAGYYWSVSWNGREILRNDGQPAWRWHEFSADVVAASELSRFAVDYAAYNWYQFDNFKIAAVPEPQQITLCVGTCLVAFALARRQNAGPR